VFAVEQSQQLLRFEERVDILARRVWSAMRREQDVTVLCEPVNQRIRDSVKLRNLPSESGRGR
jgi:hypothetical protein